ncbi:MAG TPA: hypothetical protein VLF20_01730 [Patescibacteria group bacterium]|nr:hypothetical protein [Patescibacteria group bacterium]
MPKPAETIASQGSQQKIRNIVIIEDPKVGHSPLRRSIDFAFGHLDITSLFGSKDFREVTIPRTQGRVWNRATGFIRPTLTLEERGRVTDAMEELAFSGPQGTDINFKKFYVYQDVVNGDKTKRRTIKRRPFGWQKGGGFAGGLTSVEAEHKWRVKPAQRELHARHSGANDPIGDALAREEQEFKQLVAAGADEKISILYRPQVALIAAIADKSPKQVGKETEFGKTRDQVREYWKNMMLHLGDEQLDPHDMIHGPLESVVKMLQKIQNGVGGPISSLLLGKYENEVTIAVNGITQINRQFSRDAERTTKSRVRNFVVTQLYSATRFWATREDPGSQKKSWRARIAGGVLPSEVVVEKGIDRRVNRQEVARLEDGLDLLADRTLQTDWSRKQQLLFAQEFLAMYDVVDKRDEIPDKIWDKVSAFVSPIIDNIPGLDGTRFEEKVRNALNIFDADDREKLETVVDVAKHAYAGEPRSTREQVAAILTHADIVLASDLLSPAERVLWERARNYAQRFDQGAKDAQAIVDAQAASQK